MLLAEGAKNDEQQLQQRTSIDRPLGLREGVGPSFLSPLLSPRFFLPRLSLSLIKLKSPTILWGQENEATASLPTTPYIILKSGVFIQN
ncbi:hypothetical protein CDAR_75961 [Caerostris darwini]|uniref:Uncharacterized protein n=1 Tax=Caerostris darwini TaxID=1538125 RepID=A0AAV4Q7F9_9ARAC|nr:hypothetical protein CDAR_75961 [Caerostris darwini]